MLKIRDEGLYKNLEKTQYVDDKKVTDHYAIIPTGNVNELSGQSDLNKKIYDLIVIRFLSIFYPPAINHKVILVTAIKHKEGDFPKKRVISKLQAYLLRKRRRRERLQMKME